MVDLDLAKPVNLRAEMARRGLAPNQLTPWWSPDTDSMVAPLGDSETQTVVTRFLFDLWSAALAAEARS